MNTPRSAAIYARISSDQTGEALGVTRQLEDCRKLAADQGWIVGEEYVDNDVSAYKSSAARPRPQYQRLLADLADGHRDAVIVYSLDRQTRQPMELEEFTRLCECAGVMQVKSVTADIYLGNDDGLFMARILAAIASKESARKSERLKRKARQTSPPSFPEPRGHARWIRPALNPSGGSEAAAVLRPLARPSVPGAAPRRTPIRAITPGSVTLPGTPCAAQLASTQAASLCRSSIMHPTAPRWQAPRTSPQHQPMTTESREARSDTRKPETERQSGTVRSARAWQAGSPARRHIGEARRRAIPDR